MDTMTTMIFVIVVTALFAVGGKITLFFKNREIALIKENCDRELQSVRNDHERARTQSTDDYFKQMRSMEDRFREKLAAKDQEIRELAAELESLKAWKDDIGLKLAKFEGASQGNPQMLIFKLLEHNQKLNSALTAKWDHVQHQITDDLQQSVKRIRELFQKAEELHRDGIEIVSIYESRMPDDLKKEVREEMLKLPPAPPAQS